MRPLTCLLALLLAVGCLAGCNRDSSNAGDWDPDAPFAPSLRPAFGARVTDGQLRIWTGSPCVGVTRLAIALDLGKDDKAQTVLTSGTPGGATVEHLTLGSAPPGMKVQQALPVGFDWSAASSAQLSLSGPPATWGSSVDLAEVKSGSGSHDGDTYLFQGVGWLDADQVAEQDGKSFLTTCTPDPAKS